MIIKSSSSFLQALIRNGLKISLKKCQLFKRKVTYIGCVLWIEVNDSCITPLKVRLDALMKL